MTDRLLDSLTLKTTLAFVPLFYQQKPALLTLLCSYQALVTLSQKTLQSDPSRRLEKT